MGQAKRGQMQHEENVNHARALCIEAGAIEECEIHDGVYIDTMAFTDVDDLTKHILEYNPDALENFDDKADLKECVTDAMATAGEECGLCANNREA